MSDQSLDVIGIGSAIVDVISQVPEEFLVEHGMHKGAMALIDEDDAERLYTAMPPGIEASGGSCANTVVGVASFGGRAGFIGRTRDDQLGEVFGHDIRAIGVEYQMMPSAEGPATARCLIVVTPDAQRTLNTYLGIASQLSIDDIDERFVSRAHVVYCEGYLWDLPEAKGALVKAMDLAFRNDAKVAFTLSDGFCVDRHRAEFLDLVEHKVDILFANESEICSLYETDDFDEALQHVLGHGKIACLTRSERGSVIAARNEVHVIDAHPVDEVIDTTGAGDQFAAGFLFGHTSGRDLATCGRLASLAAAEVIGHLGPRPAIDLKTLL